MPRLEGQRSPVAMYVVGAIVLIVVIVIILELLGTINVLAALGPV